MSIRYIIYRSLQSFITCKWTRTGCQRILIHSLLLIYHKLLAIDKCPPHLFSLPNHHHYFCSVSQMMVDINLSL